MFKTPVTLEFVKPVTAEAPVMVMLAFKSWLLFIVIAEAVPTLVTPWLLTPTIFPAALLESVTVLLLRVVFVTVVPNAAAAVTEKFCNIPPKVAVNVLVALVIVL